MADTQALKVFISWSGPLSEAVARALHAWLPDVFDSVTPWMSQLDIEAGQRGLNAIETELVGTSFGIVVTTQSNQHAPWLNFEAGAMSKVVADDVEQRVVPYLIDFRRPTDMTGPLTQFQAKLADEQGTKDLVDSIAKLVGVGERVVERRFGLLWPSLKELMDEALRTAGSDTAGDDEGKRDESDMLAEALGHLRAIRRQQQEAINLPPPWRGNDPDFVRASDVAKGVFINRVDIPPMSDKRMNNVKLQLIAIARQLGMEEPIVRVEEWSLNTSAGVHVYFQRDYSPDTMNHFGAEAVNASPWEVHIHWFSGNEFGPEGRDG